MPFERYLRADDHSINSSGDPTYHYQDHRHAYDDAVCRLARDQYSCLPETTQYDHHHPHAVQFQIPQFMLNGPPILAPGGGAEVLPAGLLDSSPDSFASTWLANNGFSSFHSSLISRQATSVPESVGTTSYHDFPPHGSQGLTPCFSPQFAASVGSRQKPFPEPPPSLKATTTYAPDLTSSLPSAGSSNTISYALSNALVSDSVSSPAIAAPPAIGLPVYSASGFDVISILSRVVNRPNPAIQLGPVDLSCSFVIVDVRRYDCPIVYASPTFCDLTGYSEQEVLGRNCRFLQSPTGTVAKGEPRRFVSPEAVSYIRKLLSSSKECQTTLINYRKGGQAFINLVTVIPLRGGVHNTPEEVDEVAFHVGFQVDLTEQPIRIFDKLRDGSYHNSSWGMNSLCGNARFPGVSHGLGQLVQAQNMTSMGPKGGRHGQLMSVTVSKELRNLFADTTFTDAVPISTGTNISGPTGASNGSGEQGGNVTTSLTMLVTPPSNSTSMNRISAGGSTMAGSIPVSLSPSLSLLLLEFLPDFLLVLSLKGAFLYVAPSVRLVLGYEPQELVGRSISDVCHPADLVPLMRELKEGSVSGLSISGPGDVSSSTAALSNFPKSVDLLFRALPKVPTSSSSRKTQDTFVGRSDIHPSRSSSTSAFQSPSSSGTSSSNDPSDEIAPPYIWLECRGRLHVEPGKGRKAIILSGRARWMPRVRWGSVAKAGGIGDVQYQSQDAHGSSLCMAPGSTDSLEFWALLSLQGTFLVASASVGDVLGWGSSEVIGRSIWAMARDNRNGMREHVEAELMKSDTPEVGNVVDPPPTVITTSLLHKELHAVFVRLAFYRTPRSSGHTPSSTSPIGVFPAPLIHPHNNPLCPIVCQATVLSNIEYDPSGNTDSRFGPSADVAPGRGHIRANAGDDSNEPGLMYPSDASVFEELETARGSSWQYELQQLKFANQRLHEELSALEGAGAGGGPTVDPSPCASETGATATVSLGQPCLSPSSTTIIPISQEAQALQTPSHYASLMHSTLSAPLSSIRLPNGLHEQDPPSSEWSSLAGANGQGLNPLKRSWHSTDGPTT